MNNNQEIGNILNSILKDVNVNEQTKTLANTVKDLNSQINTNADNFKGIEKRIQELEKQKHKISNSYTVLLITIVVCAFLFFLGVIYLNKQFNFGLSDDSIVVTFVGIVATFVIVSNYLQVKEVKDEFDRSATKTKNEIKRVEEEMNNRYERLQSEIQEIRKIAYESNESVDLEKTLIGYLFSIETALEKSDRRQALYAFSKIIIFQNDKEDEVKRICNANSIIVGSMDRIRQHSNRADILKEFDEFANKIYLVGEAKEEMCMSDFFTAELKKKTL
jgi:chaperonin cofactor prefoldin